MFNLLRGLDGAAQSTDEVHWRQHAVSSLTATSRWSHLRITARRHCQYLKINVVQGTANLSVAGTRSFYSPPALAHLAAAGQEAADQEEGGVELLCRTDEQ